MISTTRIKLQCFLLMLLSSTFINAQLKEESIHDKQPNIIFILADDFGIMDSQGYAKKFTKTPKDSMFYETPNIDKLITEGVSFSQAYANQLCSPTRASILTGKYAAKLGFTTAMPLRKTYYNQELKTPSNHYIHDVLEHKDDIKIEQALINGTSNSAVPTGNILDQGKNELSIAEALEGYHSGFIGKWHIGGFGARGYQPADHGFEAIAWFDAGGSPYYNWETLWNAENHRRFPELSQDKLDIGNTGISSDENYLTDDLTQQALDFISTQAKNKSAPFFLYLSHFAIHTPFQGVEEEVKYFEQKNTKAWNNHKDPIYASMIKRLDVSVGKILDKLAELKIENNTLVVFMSDNGGIDSKITPRGYGSDNSPFLGGKACLTEGGIRVPLIFRWKGKIEGDRWVDIPVDCTDIFPSLVEVAGYDIEEIIKNRELDGESLIGLLFDIHNTKNSYTKNTFYWHYPFNVIYNNPLESLPLTPHSAIRKDNFKLIFDWYGRLRLFDIEKDPFEKNDLSKKLPKVSRRLFKKLMKWLGDNVDKRYWPSINNEYNPANEVRNEQFVDLFTEHK